jgi:hypothetical protein
VTTYTHRFLCVPDAQVATARSLVQFFANTVTQGTADGMFQVGCNASGAGTPTDWVSNGMIDAQFASLLGDSNTTFAVYQAKGGTTITLAQIQALYTAAPLGTRIRSDLNSQGGGQAGLTALGLKLIAGVP